MGYIYIYVVKAGHKDLWIRSFVLCIVPSMAELSDFGNARALMGTSAKVTKILKKTDNFHKEWSEIQENVQRNTDFNYMIDSIPRNWCF